MEVSDFSVGQKPPIVGLTIIQKSWNYGNQPYLAVNKYGINVIKIGGIWIFQGGGSRSPLLVGLHVTCNAHFRTRMSYSRQKSCVKIWFGLVEPFKSYRVHKHFSRGRGCGGQKQPLGGLHLTCDAQFRIRTCYSSQKSCVKIWFGLVEIGGMLSLRRPEDPLLGGLHVTCDAHFRTRTRYSSQKSCVKIWFGLVEIRGVHFQRRGRNTLGGGGGGLQVTCDAHLWTWPSYSSQKSCVKIWFGLVEPFKSYRVHKHKKKKKKSRRDEYNMRPFGRIINKLN